MGVHQAIGYEKFPAQGAHLDATVDVCFGYATTRLVRGVVVRDDKVDPFVMIILLDDGRYVLSTECQYTIIADAKAS